MLLSVEPPVTKHEIVALTAQQFKIDGKPFEKIFNIRENNHSRTLDDMSANALFADYMEQIENIIRAVDNIGKT